jgi:hypothetical protein
MRILILAIIFQFVVSNGYTQTVITPVPGDRIVYKDSMRGVQTARVVEVSLNGKFLYLAYGWPRVEKVWVAVSDLKDMDIVPHKSK